MAFKKKQQDHLQSQITGYRSQLRQKRFKQALRVLAVVLVLFSVGYLIFRPSFNTQSQQYSFETYDLQDLNLALVNEHLEDPNKRIIVRHVNGADTLESIDDYWKMMKNRQVSPNQEIAEASISGEDNLLKLDSLSELDANVPPLPENEENTLVSETETGAETQQLYQNIDIDIRGEKMAGKRLLFFVKNYDPLLSYSVNFGNGKRGTIQQYYRHMYPNPGNYTIQLQASKNGQTVLRKSYEIFIERRTERSNASRALAENTSTPSISQTPETNATNPQVRTRVENPSQQNNSLPSTVETQTAGNQPNATNGSPVTTTTSGSNTAPSRENTANNSSSNTSSDALSQTRNAETPAVSTPPAAEVEEEEVAEVAMGPLKVADIRPSFPGGDAAMLNYLNDKIRYPQAARDHGVEGRVFVQFVVEENGSLSNIKVVKGLGYGCDKEALRIVRSMPRWIPGEHRGQKRSVIYTIPVIYQLQDY